MKKSVKILGMLFALMALVFVGCSTESETEIHHQDLSLTLSNPNGEYKVEVGVVTPNDYSVHQSWAQNVSASSTTDYVNQYRAQRNTLKQKSLENTYEDKGTMIATALKNLLMSDNSPVEEATANSSINSAELYGCNIVPNGMTSDGNITWVYIEK